MKKAKVYILSCVSMMLPVFLSAAPIDKYYVPPQQQQAQSSATQTNKTSANTDFKNKVSGLSQEQREKLKKSFQEKMKNASKNQNYDEARYYQELINILDRF